MKKHRNLIEKIAEIENLRLAYTRTQKNKRMTWGYLNFKEYDQLHLRTLQDELLNGSYRIGPYREFTIFEPKARLISALGFRDRLVQHALCNIIGPIFEASLLPYTFACRPEKGTHAGVKYLQSRLRQSRATHFLKTDFRKFFPSINRDVLHGMIQKKISCRATLALLEEIIPSEGQGLPIGSLTSQLFANVYGGAADRFVHTHKGHSGWVRYMDDMIILGHDSNALRDIFYRLRDFAAETLHLTISKWQVASVSRGINFLGYRLWPTHKLLRKSSVTRAKRRISACIEHKDPLGLDRFTAAWLGHARWADSRNLLTYLETRHDITYC